LGYKHHRQFDRTLRTTTLFVDGSRESKNFSPTVLTRSDLTIAYTFLDTKHNGLISIYSVSRHDDQLIRVDDAPYGFCLPRTYNRCTAQTFWQQDPQSIFIFRADERAKVDCIQLSRGDYTQDLDINESPLVVELPRDVDELGRRCTDVETDLDRYGDQDRTIVDMFPVYDRE
jgi:hypothetical protein